MRDVAYGCRSARLLFAIASAFQVSGARALPTTTEIEPNNSAAMATPLPLSAPFVRADGALVPGSDRDFWSINLNAGDRLWALVDTGSPPAAVGSTRSTFLQLYAGGGASSLESDYGDGTGSGGDGSNETTDAATIAGYRINATGTYYLSTTPFFLPMLTVNPMPMFVARTTAMQEAPEVEPNDSPASAQLLANPISVRIAALATLADVDVYRIDAAANDVIYYVVDADPERNRGTDLAVNLLAPDGLSIVQTADSSNNRFGGAEANRYVTTVAGTYYLRVQGPANGVPGNYDIMVARSPIEPDASANLSIQLQDAPDPVTAGMELVYDARVSNAGPDAAIDTDAILFLPVGTQVLSHSVEGGGSCNVGTCRFAGIFAAGVTRTARFRLAVSPSIPNASSLVASASAQSLTGDPDSQDNRASASTAVATRADLSATLFAPEVAGSIGQPMLLQAAAFNAGPSSANAVELSVLLPPGLTLTESVSSDGECTAPPVGGSGTIRCLWAAPHLRYTYATANIHVRADAVGNYQVTAIAAAVTTDPLPTNNSASLTLVGVDSSIKIPTVARIWLLVLALALLGIGGGLLRARA